MKTPDPGALPRGARRFVAYWLQDVTNGFQHRGWIALFPIAFIFAISVGIFVGHFAAVTFWSDIAKPIAFYAAGLAINAILLAICWAAFGRIFEVFADQDFGPWLRQRGMLGYYGFYVDYIHFTQLIAVSAMGSGLLLSLIASLPNLVHRIILGVAVACSVYAVRWAAGCVHIMQELADNKSNFNAGNDQVYTISRTPKSKG